MLRTCIKSCHLCGSVMDKAKSGSAVGLLFACVSMDVLLFYKKNCFPKIKLQNLFQTYHNPKGYQGIFGWALLPSCYPLPLPACSFLVYGTVFHCAFSVSTETCSALPASLSTCAVPRLTSVYAQSSSLHECRALAHAFTVTVWAGQCPQQTLRKLMSASYCIYKNI